MINVGLSESDSRWTATARIQLFNAQHSYFLRPLPSACKTTARAQRSLQRGRSALPAMQVRRERMYADHSLFALRSANGLNMRRDWPGLRRLDGDAP